MSFLAAAAPAAISALGSIAGGFLGGRSSRPKQPKETRMQKQQRQLVDQLIASLGGQGPFSNLFATDEAAFKKSFIDPAKSIFKNQIAPGIQQESIYGGQQRGTGLDDQLLRAGVDLDQLLNQQYMNFQGQGKDRMSNVLGSILGMGPGYQKQPQFSNADIFGQAASGYLSSPEFGKSVSDIFNRPKGASVMDSSLQAANTPAVPQRQGYEADWSQWGLNDPRWSRR